MTLKKIHRAEILHRVFASLSFTIGAVFFILFMFVGNDNSIMQTIAVKAVGFVGFAIFAKLGLIFESLAKKYKIKFAKALKRHELRAAFKAEMANL